MQRVATAVLAHPRRVLVGAAVVVVCAAVFGGPLVNVLQTSLSDFEDPASQTWTVARQIDRAIGAQDDAGLVVLLRPGADPRKRTAGAPARAQETEVAELLSRQHGYLRAIYYQHARSPELLSRDGREALMIATFATRKDSYAAAGRLSRRLHSMHASVGGLDVVFEELTRRSRTDLERAELYVLPLLILLSLWIFRGVVAALLPLLVGAIAILVTFLCLRIVDQFLGLSVFALNLVSALGLGLAIDYSLFVLSRYREELRSAPGELPSPAGSRVAVASAAPYSPEQVRRALRRTLATAGRTVAFSAVTVAAAMASLAVFPLRFLYSMGIAGVVTALCAGACALVVLPAVLALLGRRIDALSPAWLRHSGARAADPMASSFWSSLARTVMRRPGLVALLSGAVLLAAGAPALQMGLTPASSSLLPTSSQARQVDEAIKRNFAASPALPIADLVRAPETEAPTVLAYARQVARASGEPARAHLLYLKHSTWLIVIPPIGNPFSAANERIVRRIRSIPAPAPAAVGGITAWFMDQMSSLESHLPLAFAIVALAMFLTIFAMTGSVVLPAKTLVMNILTLSVATGVLVLGFQNGALGSVLDFRSNGGIEPSNLVLLFTVAFALASDYGVFLLARIKEAHDAGLANRDAVAVGLERTGRIVTAAALLFCVAVGALVSSSILSVKELGFGAALAVAVDASLVRALLVPSLMALLGRFNWWAPAPLRRLHERMAPHEGSPSGNISTGESAGAFAPHAPSAPPRADES
ncbi:MAG: MMPL family transporter [Solirubrobacteraceae bacterium]